MNSTARFLHGYNASEQGNGLIDVGAGLGAAEDATSSRSSITSSGRGAHAAQRVPRDPGHGPGIYDREGVIKGQRYTRTYTFTRTSGPNRPVLYHLRWVGNDGTFDTQNNVQLRLNVPTQVNVTVNPRTSGIHSAILHLDDSSTRGSTTRR